MKQKAAPQLSFLFCVIQIGVVGFADGQRSVNSKPESDKSYNGCRVYHALRNLEVIKPDEHQRDRAPNHIRNACGCRASQVGPELFGGNRDKHRPKSTA